MYNCLHEYVTCVIVDTNAKCIIFTQTCYMYNFVHKYAIFKLILKAYVYTNKLPHITVYKMLNVSLFIQIYYIYNCLYKHAKSVYDSIFTYIPMLIKNG